MSRELDQQIAELVMGWTRYRGLENEPPPSSGMTIFCDWDYAGQLAIYRAGVVKGSAERWSPSSGIAAAMEVVERLRQLPYEYDIEICSHLDPRQWLVSFSSESNGKSKWLGTEEIVETDSLPLAICKAALSAVTQP